MSRSARFASIGLSAGLHAALIGGLLVGPEAAVPPPPPALMELALPAPAPPAPQVAEVPSEVQEPTPTVDPPPPETAVIPPPDPVRPPPDPVPTPVEVAETPPEPPVEAVEPPPEETVVAEAADAPVVATAVEDAPEVVAAPPPKPRPPTRPVPKTETRKVVERRPDPTPPPPPAQAAPAAAAPSSEPVRPRPSGPPPNYLAKLGAWLDRHKEYPRRAQFARQQGTAMLRFAIDREGRVLFHRIERSSGYEVLDEAVEAMIRRAQPLPPIPPEMDQDRLEIAVPIDFRIR